MCLALGLVYCEDCGTELEPASRPHALGCEIAIAEAHDRLNAEFQVASDALRAEFKERWTTMKIALGGAR